MEQVPYTSVILTATEAFFFVKLPAVATRFQEPVPLDSTGVGLVFNNVENAFRSPTLLAG